MASTLLVTAAVKAGTSKTGRKVIAAVAAVFGFFIVLCIAIVSSILSIFAGGENISADFNAQDTKVYQDIRDIYDEYVVDVKKQMDTMAAEIEAKNTYEKKEPKYNPQTKKTEMVTREYCDAEVTKEYEYIKTAYVMAYLSCTNRVQYIVTRKITLNENKLISFWDDIGGIEVSQSGSDYTIGNTVMTPEEVAEEYFSDKTEQDMFLQSYYLIEQFIGIENFGEETEEGVPGNRMGIPLYYQYKGTWANMEYGNGSLSRNGCAPTCIAMVFSYLKGRTITPADIVNFTKNRYYVNGKGSSWEIFEACSEQWGIDCTSIEVSPEEIMKKLQSGKPVILSMGKGTFTSSGHFIVLTGVDETGRVTVNDPNDNSSKNFINREFSIIQIVREAKGGWCFE